MEMLVAFTLLTSVLALSAPLVVRHGRVLVTARHYRLALEELSNQMERLTALAGRNPEMAILVVSLVPLAMGYVTALEMHSRTVEDVPSKGSA